MKKEAKLKSLNKPELGEVELVTKKGIVLSGYYNSVFNAWILYGAQIVPDGDEIKGWRMRLAK